MAVGIAERIGGVHHHHYLGCIARSDGLGGVEGLHTLAAGYVAAYAYGMVGVVGQGEIVTYGSPQGTECAEVPLIGVEHDVAFGGCAERQQHHQAETGYTGGKGLFHDSTRFMSGFLFQVQQQFFEGSLPFGPCRVVVGFQRVYSGAAHR